MKFGIRKPSIKKSFAAKSSVKRYIRHNIGIKASKGFGYITNPKKALYNDVYRKTSTSLYGDKIDSGGGIGLIFLVGVLIVILFISFIL